MASSIILYKIHTQSNGQKSEMYTDAVRLYVYAYAQNE